VKIEYWTRERKTKMTRTQAYTLFPNLKDDVESEVKCFKKSNFLSQKLSYIEGLEVWMERNLDEVKNANKGFQTRTEQIEGPEKKKVIQEPFN